MNTEQAETTMNQPGNRADRTTQFTMSTIADWMRKEVRIQMARGWLVAAGVALLALLLVAID